MASFCEAFLGKRFVCCALTIVYSIYNTVGRSIASIYDLSGIFTSGRIYDLGGIFTSGRIYRLWSSLPYFIYNIHPVRGMYSMSTLVNGCCCACLQEALRGEGGSSSFRLRASLRRTRSSELSLHV